MKDLLLSIFTKLDGRKTAIGLVLVLIGSILEKIDPASGQTVADIGWSVTGLGALHKVIKGK